MKRKHEAEGASGMNKKVEEHSEHSSSDDESATSGSEDSYPDVSEEEDGSDASGDEEEEKTVDVDLEFYDPKEIDFLGLKALLQSYLDGEAYSCSELVDTIIKQPTVGTVVKTAEVVDPIGILTVLNLQRYSCLTCLKEAHQFLLSHCTDSELQQKLTQAWQAEATGLIVSERLINCPPQLAPPLQQALFDEISWAQEDEPTEELRQSFKFKQYLLVTRVYCDPAESAQPKGKKSKTKAQPLIVYPRPEDEFFHKHSDWSFTFPVANRPAQRDELQSLRLVLLIKAADVPEVRKQLDSVLGNAAK